jgi:DNA modification methylase
VVYHPIERLRLNPRNPRVHSARQIRQIGHSIENFGFVVPVLIDADLQVAAGHGRILAARQLGLTDIPTISLEHLTEAQLRAFLVADNRLSELSTWDDRLLAEQLHELSLMELDFDLEITGFDMGEVDLRIESLHSTRTADGADTLPAVSGPGVTRIGDTWLLGANRVTCHSALDQAGYAKLLEGKKAAMAFTDPPYNLKIDGNVSGFGGNRHREFAMASGEMSAGEFTIFLREICTQIGRHTVADSINFVCIDWRHFVELHQAGREAQLDLLNVCVWAKQSAGMGSLYRSQHELIFAFRNGRGHHRNNVQLGRFGRDRSNLWNYSGAVGLRRSEEGNLVALHPTVKPVAMVADAIMDVSSRGDLVLDPFLGSGTTIIAAARTGRRCYGFEIDPLYCDVNVRRWQTFTRGRAVHAESGRNFDEIAKEREGVGDEQ